MFFFHNFRACPFDQRCNFAHLISELRQRPDVEEKKKRNAQSQVEVDDAKKSKSGNISLFSNSIYCIF